jgi:L-threonylcarbamoyladenylate synthase
LRFNSDLFQSRNGVNLETIILPTTSPNAITRAVEILGAGGLVAFPTDTVYGLGALVFNGNAVKAIYRAKDRPMEKAIPILLAGVDDLPRVASLIPEMALTLAAHYWPGPLTLVIPKIPTLPEAVSAGHTIGVRVPRHSAAKALLQAAGPLAVTSANLSGKSNPTSAKQVLAQLDGRIPLLLDGGQTPGGIPSTVVDCTGMEPKILREGPISSLEIYKSLGLG